MRIEIEIAFSMWQTVFLKTDPDQLERLVCGFEIDGNLHVFYKLAIENRDSMHYREEISAERTNHKKIGFQAVNK